jgi:hypothetical protein
VPGVDLAPRERHGLGRHVGRLDLTDDRRVRHRRAEAHLVALGVVGHVAQQVAIDGLGEILPRPHHHVGLDAEVLGDRSGQLALERPRRRPAGQDDVAALQQRPDVGVAERAENLAQLTHRHPPVRTEVDPSQERHVRRHRRPDATHRDAGAPAAFPSAWRCYVVVDQLL